MTSLEGKRALVTGGGTGIGAAIAMALADAGADVVICGRRAAPLADLARASSRLTPIVADVTDEAAVRELFAAVGAADIVVANAGNAHAAPFTRIDIEAWEAMLSVNLTGVFLTFREAMMQMRGRDWGRLIAVASTAGLKGYRYVAHYCAAKHGVVGLTRALALETAGTGITANALCPGFADTPLTARSIDNIRDKTGVSAQAARDSLAATNPMGRLVQPEEVASAALFLCGPASGSMTGQAIGIAGGEV